MSGFRGMVDRRLVLSHYEYHQLVDLLASAPAAAWRMLGLPATTREMVFPIERGRCYIAYPPEVLRRRP